jgi:hypothetical protein
MHSEQLKCFEATCDRAFIGPKQRRLHLIDAHSYPKEVRRTLEVVGSLTVGQFYFSLPINGLNRLYEQFGDGVSLVRKEWKARPTSIEATSNEMDMSSESASDPANSSSPASATHADDMDQDDLSTQTQGLSISKDHLVPQQIKFGRRAKGFSKT